MFPLWLANYAVNKVNGTEGLAYADFMAAIDSEEYGGAARTERSGDDIMADFAPIIEAQRGA